MNVFYLNLEPLAFKLKDKLIPSNSVIYSMHFCVPMSVLDLCFSVLYHVLLQAYKLMSITMSCVWEWLLCLSAVSWGTCSDTVYLCWKEEPPFQRCLFGSVFPVALCPLWEHLCWGSIPLPLTLSLCWHNGPFVLTYTTAVGPWFVFSAIIHNPSPAMPLVAASLERNAIESWRNAVKRGSGKRLAGIRLWCR